MSAAKSEDEKEGVVDGCFLTWVAITEKYRKKEDKIS